MSSDFSLRPFRSRARLVMAWRGLALGTVGGSLLALAAWAGDRADQWTAGWPVLAGLVGAGAVIGLVAGATRRLDDLTLARSLDRRADLKDATVSSLESEGQALHDRIEADAAQRLERERAARLYPLRFGLWQGAALGSVAVLLGLVLLADGVLVPADVRLQREQLKKAAAEVERVAKPLTEKQVAAATAEEKSLARDLQEFARQLDRARIDPEAALQKAEQLKDHAAELAAERNERFDKLGEQTLAQAALERMERANLTPQDFAANRLDPQQAEIARKAAEEAGIDIRNRQAENSAAAQAAQMDELQRQLAGMTPEERSRMSQELQRQAQEMREQLNREQLSAEERQRLEEQIRQREEIQQRLQLTEEQLQALQELTNSPEMREMAERMQEMMEQAREAQEQARQEGRPMTEEEMQQLQEQLEQLAEAARDPAAREALRRAMEQMMEQMEQGMNLDQIAQGMGMGLGLTPGMGSSAMGSNGMRGPGGPGSGGQMDGEGEVPRQDNSTSAKVDGQIRSTRGQRDEKRGTDAFLEVRAPTTLGSRTSVPYSNVLPTYNRRAESALNGGKVPKKHQQRVRDYFKSLGGG